MLASFLSSALNTLTLLEMIELSVLPRVELLFVPLITIIYLLVSKNKSLLFVLFLVSYSVADILHLSDTNNDSTTLYFVCNSLYLLSNVFLLAIIIRAIDFKRLYKNFLLQIIVLFILDAYLFIVLYGLIEEFMYATDYVVWVKTMEYAYNFVLLLLLSFSFLLFLEKSNRKSLFLFLGCIGIIFSEILLIGYYFVLELDTLKYLAIALNVISFSLLFIQTRFKTSLRANKKGSLFTS
ncbi:hypothetical protein DFR65_10231 [Oceanihabitans sediminis]|nr:hypothetical protein DFR65_10231 [Oceanihabitans sediminis]